MFLKTTWMLPITQNFFFLNNSFLLINLNFFFFFNTNKFFYLNFFKIKNKIHFIFNVFNDIQNNFTKNYFLNDYFYNKIQLKINAEFPLIMDDTIITANFKKPTKKKKIILNLINFLFLFNFTAYKNDFPQSGFFNSFYFLNTTKKTKIINVLKLLNR